MNLSTPLSYIILGVLTGFVLLIYSNFIPYTEFRPFSIVQKNVGTRLYIWNYHIHHYIIGIVLLIPAFCLIKIKKYLNFAWFLIGLGIILIIDELPNLISGEMHPYLSTIITRG